MRAFKFTMCKLTYIIQTLATNDSEAKGFGPLASRFNPLPCIVYVSRYGSPSFVSIGAHLLKPLPWRVAPAPLVAVRMDAAEVDARARLRHPVGSLTGIGIRIPVVPVFEAWPICKSESNTQRSPGQQPD